MGRRKRVREWLSETRSRAREDIGEQWVGLLVVFFVVACMVWIALFVLSGANRVDDVQNFLHSLAVSALITLVVFVVMLFLSRAGERRVMERFDRIDKKLDRLDTIEVIMLRMLNMMEADRGMKPSTLDDVRREAEGSRRRESEGKDGDPGPESGPCGPGH